MEMLIISLLFVFVLLFGSHFDEMENLFNKKERHANR